MANGVSVQNCIHCEDMDAIINLEDRLTVACSPTDHQTLWSRSAQLGLLHPQWKLIHPYVDRLNKI